MNWSNYDLITMVEEIADMNNWIASEEELSERFDSMIQEIIDSGESVDTDDTIAMNERFNNWSDGLCKDGEIHLEQYRTYEYVGEWS